MPFFQPHFQDIHVVNIGARSNVLYSKDAEFNIDFGNDNFFSQNVNQTQVIWLFVGGYGGMSLSL